nr:hypothetical protein CFP56_17129 [Quercus suber]
MVSEKTVSTIVRAVMIMILTLFIVNSKPVETKRLFVVVMKSYKLETAKVVPVSQVRAPTPPSASNSCTYLPGPPGFCQHIKYYGSESDHNKPLLMALKNSVLDNL